MSTEMEDRVRQSKSCGELYIERSVREDGRVEYNRRRRWELEGEQTSNDNSFCEVGDLVTEKGGCGFWGWNCLGWIKKGCGV